MKTPEEFLNEKYAHQSDAKDSKFGFYEVISIIEEYVNITQCWIPVEEEMPTHREVVLCKVKVKNYPLLFCYNEIKGRWYQYDDGDFYESEMNPTHWRPIQLK